MKPWIERYAKRGLKELAISSSGNSAISAGRFCADVGITLHVFVSPHIDEGKRARIGKYKNVILRVTRTPNRDAFRFCKERGIVNLRASKDNFALDGYRDIAFELMEQLPRIDNIFIPTSSGATLEGMYNGFYVATTPSAFGGDPSFVRRGVDTPSFFAVQTTKVHPIASYFDKDFAVEKTSPATAIVGRVAHRRDRVLEIIKETGGGGFVISNTELEGAREILQAARMGSDPVASGSDPGNLDFGWHSVLSFAGFLKWQKQNLEIAKQQTSVCLFTD
jgi:threonine synthase